MLVVDGAVLVWEGVLPVSVIGGPVPVPVSVLVSEAVVAVVVVGGPVPVSVGVSLTGGTVVPESVLAVVESEVVVVPVVVPVVGKTLHTPILMVLLSRVTAPLRANIPPCEVAPVLSVMEVVANKFPTKFVCVPSVAELPIAQYTLHACAPLINNTCELDAVVSVEPIWNTQTLLALPCPSRVRSPVSCAEDG